MSHLVRKYREMSFEQKTVFTTVLGLCSSTVLASGKLVIGALTNYHLCTVAVYTFAILLAKLECLLGVKSDKLPFQTRNLLTSVFLFLASAVYIGFMFRLLFLEREATEYSLTYVVIVAFISFCELGFAITGVLRMKRKGHYYRNIKIINFCIALIAILTTQMTILDYMSFANSNANSNLFNSLTGIGVGGFIALCAVYILAAPKISVIDREHNVFVLAHAEKNNLIDMGSAMVDILLSPSRIYGSYLYRASVQGEKIDGHIIQEKSVWNRMPVLLKILCCILSEILLFVWLAGRLLFFLRSMNIPQRLESKMECNGFKKIET